MQTGFSDSLGIILTLVVLEAVLSFDNAAILAVMSRKLPNGGGRKRALNYGLGIAYVLRILAILVATTLANNTWFLAAGGLYLVFIFGKHFLNQIQRKRVGHPHIEHMHAKGMWGMSALTVVILQIGLIDLAFALDQVVAAVSFTQESWLIIVAATLGLLSLRILAPVISRLMDWLPLLEHMAFVAVGFVGSLLLLEHPLFGFHPIHLLDPPVKITITLSLFVVPILVKAIFKVPRGGHSHAQTQRDLDKAQPQILPSKKT